CQPTFGHSARSVFRSSTSGAAHSGGAVRRTARPGDGSRSWRMTFSPGPASFIRGPKSASPSNTRGGSRVPEWGPLGSVRGALSNERPYRDLRNVVAKYPFERSHRFPGIQPNFDHRDYSRLSCGVEVTQTFRFGLPPVWVRLTPTFDSCAVDPFVTWACDVINPTVLAH